ncbi:hypothetical protein ACQCVH_17690 [Bacillus infantis]|uniref:hypothetical protein n=1 Tax=Bacillus infantis TaxID=324767 RepID=UPI003CE7DABA
MNGAASLLFALCGVLFLGAVYYVLASKKPGVYPPKSILKEKGSGACGGGSCFLSAGIYFDWIFLMPAKGSRTFK